MTRHRRLTAALTAFLAAMVALAGVAFADQLVPDSNATLTGSQAGARSLTLAAGSSQTITVGAWVDSPGPDVSFPVLVTVAEKNDNSGILSELTLTDGSIEGYGVENEAKASVKVTAPSTGLTCGQDNAFAGAVEFDAGSTPNLNPSKAAITISLTVPGPACQGPTAPTVDAGSDVAGAEGSAISLDATVGGGANTGLLWTYSAGSGVDSGATCSFAAATATDTTITCTDDGTYTATLTAAYSGGSVSDTATVTVSNAAPAVGTVQVTQTEACSIGISAAFTDAGSNDTHTSLIDWGDGSDDTVDPEISPVTGSHTYTSAGTKTITVTVTDDDHDADAGISGRHSNTGEFVTGASAGAIKEPINTTGTRSSFKIGSTIPVKIDVLDCAGQAVSGLTLGVSLVKLDNSSEIAVNESPPSATADPGTTMRWDGSQYIYNLSTKNSQFTEGGALTTGTYKVTVSGSFYQGSVSAQFDARK